MRYAIINDASGMVENIVEAGPDYTSPDDGTRAIETEGANIGWRYSDGSFYPPPTPVPEEIALWQARAVLAKHNALQGANLLVERSGDAALQTFWEYGNSINRNSGVLMSLASALGMNDAQVDALFREAANLSL